MDKPRMTMATEIARAIEKAVSGCCKQCSYDGFPCALCVERWALLAYDIIGRTQ